MITPEQEAANELDRVIAYLEALGDKEETELCTLMNKDSKTYARLLVAIGSLTTKAAGNANKIYELVTALELQSEYDSEKYEICHVKHKYGADIVIKNKETLEEKSIDLKHSMTVKGEKDKYHSSWNMSVNLHLQRAYQNEPTQERLAILIDTVYKKLNNGVASLIARRERELLNHYEIDGHFMALYCAKKLSTASCNAVNMGCDRCVACGHYHRAFHLQAWGEELAARILANGPFVHTFAYFSRTEWSAICGRVDSQCGRGRAWICSVVAHQQGAGFVLPRTEDVNKK